MTRPSIPAIDEDYAWLVAIPKHQAFTQPQFHFGERVKWSGEDAEAGWFSRTGRIIGMQFTHSQGWYYHIQLDSESETLEAATEPFRVAEADLTLIPGSDSIRSCLKPESEWMSTQQAAQILGVSPEQLRKLRRKQMFKVGYHYRDTSIPGSGLPRWQWHVVRCGKALELPPEKRQVQSS